MEREQITVGTLAQINDVSMTLILEDIGYRNYVQLKYINGEWVTIVLFEKDNSAHHNELKIHKSSVLWKVIRRGTYIGHLPIREG